MYDDWDVESPFKTSMFSVMLTKDKSPGNSINDLFLQPYAEQQTISLRRFNTIAVTLLALTLKFLQLLKVVCTWRNSSQIYRMSGESKKKTYFVIKEF